MFKPNVLIISGMSFLAFMGIGAALVYGGFAMEIQLILAAALGAAGTAFIALASQVAGDPPPNPHKALLDYQIEMEKLRSQ